MNKPKYKFIKNFKYALDGLNDLIHNETSFKLDVIFVFVFSIFIFLSSYSETHKLILFFSLIIPIYSEIINSIIERIVDLVTQEKNLIAKKAKDIGSFLVLTSYSITFFIWGYIIYLNLN